MKEDLEITLEQEEEYEVKARYTRNKYGYCPALREEKGKCYCSKMIPCEQYAMEEFVYVKHEDRNYIKCKFIEKGDVRGPKKV